MTWPYSFDPINHDMSNQEYMNPRVIDGQLLVRAGIFVPLVNWEHLSVPGAVRPWNNLDMDVPDVMGLQQPQKTIRQWRRPTPLMCN